MSIIKAAVLNQLLLFVNTEIPLIQYGGCGVFAASLYSALSRLGYRCGIVCLDDTGGGTKTAVREFDKLCCQPVRRRPR